MSLEWMPRDNSHKDHALHSDIHWGTEPPCVVFEKRPIKDQAGKVVDGLFTAVVRLNNPAQFNSYTTEMVKGVIAGFENASLDRSVVAVVFTGTGPYAFCTGGNTKEYSEYYSMRCDEYGQYMELFNHMVNAILMCKKPTICRVNGMRVAGGQEIGMACDIAVASGPRHIRPGRTSAWIGARRGLIGFSALVPFCGRRHVELHFLRNVVRIQNEGEKPDHQGRARTQGGWQMGAQPHRHLGQIRGGRGDRIR